MSSSKPSTFDIVLKLQNLGFSVIPSGGGSSGKAPLVKWKEWQDKVPDEQRLRSWQQEKNPALWGIVTNSNVAVIDADTSETRARLTAELGEPHVVTPRGGAHWYTDTAGHPLKTVAGMLPGIDSRGVGGFVNIIGENLKTVGGRIQYWVLDRRGIKEHGMRYTHDPTGKAEWNRATTSRSELKTAKDRLNLGPDYLMR